MKGTPLIKDIDMYRRAQALALKMVPNLADHMTEAQVRFLEERLSELKPAALRALDLGGWREGNDWVERNGVIHLSVHSIGVTGREWISRLQSKGVLVETPAQRFLMSDEFRHDTGVTSNLVILKGKNYSDILNARSTRRIRENAAALKMKQPNSEVICLIADKFSHEEILKMGVGWIVSMANPHYVDGVPNFLAVRCGAKCLAVTTAAMAPEDGDWDINDSFAFIER